jgi:hypothetical protein
MRAVLAQIARVSGHLSRAAITMKERCEVFGD